MSKDKKVISTLGLFAVIILCLSYFYFFIFIKTPEYSLRLVRESINKHDVQTFKKHVDLKLVYGNLFDNYISLELKANPNDSFTNNFVLGIAKIIKPAIVEELVTQTEKQIANIEKPAQENNDNNKIVSDLNKTDDLKTLKIKNVSTVSKDKDSKIANLIIAVTDTQINQDFQLNIKMSELSDGTWQIIEISNAIEFFKARESIKNPTATN